MIITKIQGGLGNQMFQYAAARALADKPVLDTTALDTSPDSDEHFTKRAFELDIFKLNKNFLSVGLRKLIFSRRLLPRLVRKLFLNLGFVKQKGNDFIEIPNKRNLYLDGYFQSEKYFMHKRKEILKSFAFPDLDTKNAAIANEIKACENAVSLHIRRGDYLKPQVIKIHGILPETYYETAITKIIERYPNAVFYIFSDDPKYVSQKYADKQNCRIVDLNSGADSWKDMALMALCKHHIIANSSFSWWGAWLSEHHGLNIAPLRWFNPDNVRFNINDFIPPTWIKI